MSSGISFSKIVIIQSLNADEVKTGSILYDYVSSLVEEHRHDIPVEIIDCQSSDEFTKVIDDLIVDARDDVYPIVHIECHGHPQDGLDFSDGSDLSWEQVSVKTEQLNFATDFNLLLIFSACFGDYFSHTMGITKPAPCWCAIGPSLTVMPDEILYGLRAFYSEFLTNLDIGEAVKRLEGSVLLNGEWICRLTEEIFIEVCHFYLASSCTLEAGAQRIDEYLKGNQSLIVREIFEKKFREKNSQKLYEYFDRYFLVGDNKANKSRFGYSLARVERLINEFKDSGNYYL
ncbi:hypothetical protein [Pseudomonas sp. DR48]|jgi:hypothetical protein|uniref:hypothetical protein n=1 Tax=Pseudomonas sp. DR48 TaxID=2871095 RepID=UPI001C9A1F08|nr:hypothetical protein [Pseudomonas sp. DR48]QZP30487.1 hypothetical protein K5K95_20060 [Pseudomonas sp. DR48]